MLANAWNLQNCLYCGCLMLPTVSTSDTVCVLLPDFVLVLYITINYFGLHMSVAVNSTTILKKMVKEKFLSA